MNMESSGYDPMSVRNLVDDIYSSHEVQEQIRAERAIAWETTRRHTPRVLRVETLMNDYVSQLFGERSEPDRITTLVVQPKASDNDAAAEDELPVV